MTQGLPRQEYHVPHPDPDFTLIKAALLIDGNGGPPVERGAVLVEGGLIRAAGSEEEVAPPEGAAVRELHYENGTLLPGLVDCHVHLNGVADGRSGDDLALLSDELLSLQSARNARAHLYSGVTTVRDCGAKHRTAFMLREAVAMGVTPAPRLVLSGRPIAIIGGHLSYFGEEATGPVECRASVRRLVKEGADFIKVTATGGSTRTSFPFKPSFTVEELSAICDEAHKFGKHVAAHCSASQGILNALDAGVDTIIHGYHREPDGGFCYRPEITERIAAQGVFVNPTLHQHRERMWQLEEKRDGVGLDPQESAELDEIQRTRDAKLEHFSMQRAAGVRQVCGSDSAWAYYPMGDFQSEIEAHVEAGMSPMEAILAATADSASSCWIQDEVGTLEPGKQADMLVVDGNPSADISALRKVVDVFQRGNALDRDNRI